MAACEDHQERATQEALLTAARENDAVMETKRRIILKRRDGVPMNLFFEPVRALSQAARFSDLESFYSFLHGVYAPSDPSIYYPQLIEITYREVDGLDAEK